MKQALAGAMPTSGGSTIAEGIAVKQPGQLTREIIGRLVSDILLVSEGAIERTVHQLMSVQKLVVEGAGAAGVAAILAQPERFAGRRVATVICGGNIDDRLLASVLMRGLVREGRMVRLRIAITDAPGTLAKVAGLVGEAGGNIVEVHHHRLFSDVPVKMADIDVVVETRDLKHVEEVVNRLKRAGFPTELMGTVE
jgi:threonine dehydratase